jgi:hypothetical protein
MAIAFKCPSCQQPYKVKDDMAGKKVVCTSCKNPIRVPAPIAAPAVPHHEADALAAAHLTEAPAPAEEAASNITVECPNCMEQVTFPADKAGKQAPCPNCKRVVRVPVPATGRKDWRTADARPTFAKVTPETDLKDVVSTAHMTVVDRESLAEAGALRPKREREPLPLRTKVTYVFVGGAVLVLLAVAIFVLRTKTIGGRRGDFLAKAVALVKENTGLPAGVRAETYRAAGEYVLAQPDGKADDARGDLANARAALTPQDGKGVEQPFEKTALLTRIVVTQTGLVGDRDQVRNGLRLEWDPTLRELRHTLAAFDTDPGQWEGTVLGVRALTRALGLRGPSNVPAIVSVVTNRFETPAERADALAAVGLELLAANDAGRKKAEELAALTKDSGTEVIQPRALALQVALKLTEPPAESMLPTAVRVGVAEGLARRGDLDAARAMARRPGNPEDRLQALVAIAAVQAADSDMTDAVKFFADEFKARDLPDWSLFQLAQLCADAKSPEAAKGLHATLTGLSNLSPRSQAVRAWAQMELLQSPHLVVTESAVKSISPETALGHRLAWECLARRTTPGGVDGWPEPVRPLGMVGSALGSIK